MRKHSATLFLLTWLACPVLAKDARPNILLLMAEDLSPRIGAFGDAVARTPNIDQLAREGVKYTQVFTTAGVCAPSRAAIIMGVHQIAFGAQHMRSGDQGYKAVPPPEMKAFPEMLRAAGYYTFTTDKLDYQFSGALPTSESGPFTIWDSATFGGETGWRDRPGDEPFFGYVNFMVTHESGVFPPLGHWPHSFMHLIMQVMRAVRVGLPPDDHPVTSAEVSVAPYYPDTPTVRADLARHYNNIGLLDAEIGALLAGLEADGLADDTIVIWTTDHGDGLPRAKRELYDSGLRVPMIIRWPEQYRPAGVAPGDVEERLVSGVDFAPAILSMAGVEVAPHMQGRDFTDPEVPAREFIHASRDRIDEIEDRQRAVRDARFKYIRSYHPDQEGGHALAYRDNLPMMREMAALHVAGELDDAQQRWFEPPGEERLFDLAADPHELDDLSADPAHASTLARMRAALEAWQARVEDWSDGPETEMLARFHPDGEIPVTRDPQVELAAGMASISCPTDAASIGYRIDDGPWQLYTEPVPLPEGSDLAAKAVRYGWEESGVVEFRR